jgi:glycosyltransferase involved in cell wall biosynthesis
MTEAGADDAGRFVLQVSTADVAGGAERVAWNLFTGLRAAGLRSRLAVGYRRGDDPDVVTIAPRGGGPWARAWNGVAGLALDRFGGARAAGRAALYARRMAAPGAWLDLWRGHECFRFPGTRDLFARAGGVPDLVHAHNLHGGYFDLRALPWLCGRAPLVWTLHDTWAFTGHCSYPLECERWRTGCGACPHLDTHPAVRRDATDRNHAVKRAIYANSRLWVATPSRWLLDKARDSILAPAIVEGRVIPNGLDLGHYRPGSREAARAALGIAPDARVAVFVGNRFLARDTWKDYPTVRDAVVRAAARLDGDLHLYAVGDEGPDERVGAARLHVAGHHRDPEAVATWIRAADVALHAARVEAENYPNVVIEALACGVPVVATAVGGVPEQIVGCLPGTPDAELARWNPAGPDAGTGVLVPVADAERMAVALETLLRDAPLRHALGDNAARRAREEHDLARQVERYRAWYDEILAAWRA